MWTLSGKIDVMPFPHKKTEDGSEFMHVLLGG